MNTPTKRLLDGTTPVLFIDQYGHAHGYHRTVKSLMRRLYAGRAVKMYVDHKDGTTRHCGYIIAGLWLTAYHRVEVPVSESPDDTTVDERVPS